MYQLCRRPRPGGRFSFRYRIKDTDKKAWYDQNIEFWLYRYYIYTCVPVICHLQGVTVYPYCTQNQN